jgi:uncharacterized protein
MCIKKIALCLAIFIAALQSFSTAQTYADSLAKHREKYKEEFLSDEHSPLKQEDLAYLRFYEANTALRVPAKIKLLTGTDTIIMKTLSGKEKTYVVFAQLEFKINKKTQRLFAYRSITLMKDPEHSDHVFVPFTDNTNYKTTYGGGRYLDFTLKDFSTATIIIDFNKAYNPYCAFAGGYNCPIPPKENNLRIAITAGEKLFGKASTQNH